MSELLLAFGARGLRLQTPEGATLRADAPVEEAPSPIASAAAVREAFSTAGLGTKLSELATGKRRAVILVGDLAFPARYDLVLPELAEALIARGVRASRILFRCVPGGGGPALGRFAIRRYGEATVGAYALENWGTPAPSPEMNVPFSAQGRAEDPPDATAEGGDAAYAAADLRLAVLPDFPGAREALPRAARAPEDRGPGSAGPPDLTLFVAPGRGPGVEVVSIRAEAAAAAPAENRLLTSEGAPAVALVTGGGAPTDETLEEALLGLRFLPGPAGAEAAVVAFDGREGLGSARFTLDLRALLRQAEAELVERGRLPAPEEVRGGQAWDPAGALAEALCRHNSVILFSPGLAEQEEGRELAEQLAESPHLAKRLALVEAEAALWVLLAERVGPRYFLLTEPLGWRGRAPRS
jgi:hypothetical protein